MPASRRDGALARGQVIDRQHRVRLAAAEGGLELNDRLAALAVQPLRDLRQQQAHALGDEGALKEGDGVLVFRRRLARLHRRDVGSELGLLERALPARPRWGTAISRQGFMSWFLSSYQIQLCPASAVAVLWRQRISMPVQTGDEFVVGAGVLGLAEALAERVEAVGELADGFGFAPTAARSAPAPIRRRA